MPRRLRRLARQLTPTGWLALATLATVAGGMAGAGLAVEFLTIALVLLGFLALCDRVSR